MGIEAVFNTKGTLELTYLWNYAKDKGKRKLIETECRCPCWYSFLYSLLSFPHVLIERCIRFSLTSRLFFYQLPPSRSPFPVFWLARVIQTAFSLIIFPQQRQIHTSPRGTFFFCASVADALTAKPVDLIGLRKGWIWVSAVTSFHCPRLPLLGNVGAVVLLLFARGFSELSDTRHAISTLRTCGSLRSLQSCAMPALSIPNLAF